MKNNLIKIFTNLASSYVDRSTLDKLCDEIASNGSCSGIDCVNCPFNDKNSLINTVKILEEI